MKTNWQQLVTRWPGIQDVEPTLVERIVKRLEAGDVMRTKYGMRVECRNDLGDNRQAAAAYWPKLDTWTGEWSCKCWAWKADGVCSHVLAVRVWLWAEDQK